MADLSPAVAEKEWKSDKFRPVYLLVGEEASAKTAFLAKLRAAVKPDDFNLNEWSGEAPGGVQEAVSAALTPPMFSPRRLVILKNAKLGVEARKAIAEYLKDPLSTTVLAISVEDRKPEAKDPMTSAAAALSGVLWFKPLKEEEACARLSEAAGRTQLSIEDDAVRLLVQEAGTDWGILQAELDKIVLFVKGRDRIVKDDVVACLGYKQSSNPFDLPRILQARDRTASLRQLRRLLAEGVEPFRILYQISGTIQKQLKAKRLVASGKDQFQIFRELRLNDYYDRDFLPQLASVSEGRLVAELRACVDLEAKLKSQAWLEAGIELERFVAAMGK